MAAPFPTTLPPDTDEIREYIRFWGSITDTHASDDVMNIFIDKNIDLYEEDLCKITYFSTINILEWLVRKENADSAGTGSSGAVSKRKEKNNRRQIEVEYEESGTSTTGWAAILQDLRDNPTTIGCNPYSDVPDSEMVCNVIIGGADINGYEAGNRTAQSFTAARQNRRRYPKLY